MGIRSGDNKIKMMSGDLKIKRAYAGDVKIYSSGNIVTYCVDAGVSYQEEVEEGESCLSPKSFAIPAKSGYTFAGWSESSNGAILSSCIMGDEPITLYAVWKAVPFSPIINGVLQSGTYIRAWPLVYNVISGDAGGYNLPAPGGDDGLSNVYGHSSHTSGNGTSFVGAEIYFYSNGLKTLKVTPRKYGNHGTIALLVYGDNEKNIYDNEIANHGTQYTINISNHSVIHIIVRIYDTSYNWLGGGIQTITCS